jgi:hypothetical protein
VVGLHDRVQRVAGDGGRACTYQHHPKEAHCTTMDSQLGVGKNLTSALESHTRNRALPPRYPSTKTSHIAVIDYRR